MSKLDALIKRTKHLQGLRSNERLEAQWANMCAGAKEELLALLEAQIANDDGDEEESQVTDEELEDFTAMLSASAELAKQHYFQNARRRKRPSLV